MKKIADRPPNLRRAYFESRFGQLHCRTAFPSTGGFDELTPLVGLHDAPGSGANLAPLLAMLGKDRSVYLPDLPGCGQSDAPAGAASITDYAVSVGEMLQGLRLRQIDVLGVGAGAAIAVELALWFGPGLRRLVLAELPQGAAEPDDAPLLQADGGDLQAQWLALAGSSPDTAEMERLARLFGERVAGGSAARWPAIAASRWPLPDRIALLTMPVLVLERDRAGQSVRTMLPSARVEALPMPGDFSPREAARNVRALRDFLDG